MSMSVLDIGEDEEVVTLVAIAREWDPHFTAIRPIQVLLMNGTIPARKIGHTWITTRTAIREARAAYKGKGVKAA